MWCVFPPSLLSATEYDFSRDFLKVARYKGTILSSVLDCDNLKGASKRSSLNRPLSISRRIIFLFSYLFCTFLLPASSSRASDLPTPRFPLLSLQLCSQLPPKKQSLHLVHFALFVFVSYRLSVLLPCFGEYTDGVKTGCFFFFIFTGEANLPNARHFGFQAQNSLVRLSTLPLR